METDALNAHYMALQQSLNQQRAREAPIRSYEIDHAVTDQPMISGEISMTNLPAPIAQNADLNQSMPAYHHQSNQHPLHARNSSIPAQIFSQSVNYSTQQQPQQFTVNQENLSNAQPSNHSPLRRSSPEVKSRDSSKSPMPNLRERSRQATEIAAMNASVLMGMRSNNNNSAPMGNQETAKSPTYSPLRTKSPTRAEKDQQMQDTLNLQNQSISASNISHVSPSIHNQIEVTSKI